jgi:hypothetical protein
MSLLGWVAMAEKRNLLLIGKQPCPQYKNEVTLFIEPRAPSGWQLVAQYDDGAEFAAGIPADWTVRDLLRLIDRPGSQTYPAWEIPARGHGSPELMWPGAENL